MDIPDIHISFKPLQDLLLKKSEANILLAAIELDLFSLLEKVHFAEDIAQKCQFHLQNTIHLLNALAAFDVIQKDGDRYFNSPIAHDFLVKGKDTYLGDYLCASDPWYSIHPEKISLLVREGPPERKEEIISGSDEFREMQTRGSINYQRSGMAQIVVKQISSLPEYNGFSRMLDLGCGPGILGIALILDHPTMNGVLFDQPPVAEVAKRCAAEYGVSDRITVMSGDYLVDSIGEEYDLILASMTLNYALGSFDRLMKKIYEALRPGGVFVTVSDGTTRNGTKPEEMVISMLIPGLMGQDMAIHEDFIANAMLDAGFYKVRSRPVQTPVGEVEWTIGKKLV